jgi:hypothetical protein
VFGKKLFTDCSLSCVEVNRSQMSGRPVGSIGILARTEFLRTTGVAAGRAIQRCITARIPAATMCGVLWSLRRPGRLRRRCRSESLNSASTRPSAKADPRAHSSFRRHARRAGRWSLTRSRSKTHSPSVSPSTRLIVCHAPSGSSWRVRRRSRLARGSCSHAATTDPDEERRAEQWQHELVAAGTTTLQQCLCLPAG